MPYLFQFNLSTFSILDLSLFIDDMALLLVLKDDFESLSNLCRLVMDRDLTFQKGTYKELITYVLPRDDVLANQMFLYATFLGCYPKVKVNSQKKEMNPLNFGRNAFSDQSVDSSHCRR